MSRLWDEAVKIGGANPDFNCRDLWEAIDRGDFLEYDLGIQVFDQGFAKAQFYEPQPRHLLCRDRTGCLHAPERAAGDRIYRRPAVQGQLFSYLDTQKSRLETANFFQLPINAPRCPFANMQRDGMARR